MRSVKPLFGPAAGTSRYRFAILGGLLIFTMTTVPLGCGRSAQLDQAASFRSEPLGVGDRLPRLDPASWLNQPPEFSPDRLQGKVVVVEAFATWCAPCRVETPRLVRLYQEKKTERLEFVALTTETGSDIDNLREFMAAYDIPWPIGFGAQSTLESLGVTSIPMTFVVGRDGRVTWNSQLGDSSTGLADAIDQALADSL